MVTMCRIRFTHFLAPSIIASQPKSKQYFRGRLAYSGGLDTSIIIPWLKEHYDNCGGHRRLRQRGLKRRAGRPGRTRQGKRRVQAVCGRSDRRVCRRLRYGALTPSTARILPPLPRAATINKAMLPALSPSTACPLRYRRWWKPKTNKRTGNFSYVNSSYRHQLGR